MADLNQLIEKYGTPDALIDHWDESSIRFAVWGFEEYFNINAQGKAFLNGDSYGDNPIVKWQNVLDRWKSESNEIAAVGFISYDFKNILFPHLSFKSPSENNSLLWFGKPKQVIRYKQTETEAAKFSAQLQLYQDIPPPDQYKQAIAKIKDYLRNGHSYQINFTQPKKFRIKCNPFDLYLSGRERAKPHYGYYLNTGDSHVLSFSPERFFKTGDGMIESCPMKGTRPRSNDLIQDERLAGELYHSKKDRAEHLMIVDLIRNDLGKVCEFGSVKVENLYGIQSFETVHQMVSRVYGKLNEDINETEIISALFPGGSITGAPKERSMEIIDELEGYSRGIYTGGLGYITAQGDMDFNIGIRTMTVKGSAGVYPVGGGIVWDSEPLEEWLEAQQKGKILSPLQIETSGITPQLATIETN